MIARGTTRDAALWLVVGPLTLAACSEGAAPGSAPIVDTPAPAFRMISDDPSDLPIAELSPEHRARFEEGDARFELPFREAQGLGPHYIHRSCISCHEGDARGPGAVRRIVPGPGQELPYGDVVRPRLSGGGRTPLEAPAGATTTTRFPPAVFARGYLEAIADETLLAWAAAQAARGDEISGRAAVLPDDPLQSHSTLAGAAPRLGRFGLKARSAALESFVAEALLSDMGLTSPLRPDENPNPDGLRDDARPGTDVDAEVVHLMADYVRLLAVPPRAPADPVGERIFAAVGCAACHVPSARTRVDHPVAALRDREVELFTDLLLHDMGEGLADHIPEGAASGSEWRTAPLIGIRFLRALLHDGRATSVDEAIRAHASPGSEANGVVARYAALAPSEASALCAYVEGL